MKTTLIRLWFAAHFFLVGASPAAAQGRVSAARETAQYVLQHFGGPAFRMEAAVLASKIETYAARHGSGFLQAVRRVGPRAFTLVEEAGVHSKQVVGVLARYGEHGATWVVARPKGMQLLLQHGEEAAIKALQSTGTQGGRRLAMMAAEGGELARIGRSPEVLDVIGRYGEPAMKFVWENKVALATTVGLVAFLANPEPFINGARDIASVVGSSAVKPLMQVPAAAVEGVARSTNWTLIFLAAGATGLFLWLLTHGYLSKWLRHEQKPPAVKEKAAAPVGVNGVLPSESRKQ
jgi:hypothetical protein